MDTRRYGLPGAIVLFIVGIATARANIIMEGGEINFSGRLVSQPCNLDPASGDINVRFGSLSTQELRLNGKSEPQPIKINLKNCNSSVKNSVTVTFNGTEDVDLNGRLATSGAAEGIAIRLLNDNGSVININQPAAAIQLQDGDNVLDFSTFVEVKMDQPLNAGDFLANANFILQYP